MAFGNEPSGLGPKGLRADQPPPSTGDDLHAIRVRYCGPKTLNGQAFSFAANQGLKYDLTGQKVNGILLTTMTGQVNVYFGESSSQLGKAALTPDAVGSASIVPNTQFIPLPPATDYIFTLQEGAGSTTTGKVTFMYQ